MTTAHSQLCGSLHELCTEEVPLEPAAASTAAGSCSATQFAQLLDMQEQRLAREAAADRLRAVSHLVMGVAHELNTPLEIIRQAAEVVARDGNDEVREAVALICANVTRASRLIRQCRSLSVTETPDDLQPVDVASAVADAVRLYRRTGARESLLDVRVVDRLGNADGNARWQGYPQYLAQVLLNLLTNAEQHGYRDAGGRVEIVCERRGDRLRVTVEDFGTGIAERHAESVLHPFFTTGRSRGRAGLGLAIVHNIVTAGMHGTVDIESQVGEGTRVHIEMPWAPTSAAGVDQEISEFLAMCAGDTPQRTEKSLCRLRKSDAHRHVAATSPGNRPPQ